jgi:hypothetical protein
LTNFIASAIVGIGLDGEGADDASTFEPILSTTPSIFRHVFLYILKNGLFSSLSSAAPHVYLRFFSAAFDFFKADSLIAELSSFFYATSNTASLEESPEEISPGQNAIAPMICILSNKKCKSSRYFGPRF